MPHFRKKTTGFIIVRETGLWKTMWRLHLTFDKLQHLSTYACGGVTLGRFVNFEFKTFQFKDYGQKYSAGFIAHEQYCEQYHGKK